MEGKNAKKVTRYSLFSLLAAQPADCWHAGQIQSQISISPPKDKEAFFSQIAQRHVTVARCDVRSALCDQQEVNAPQKTWALPETLAETRQQGVLRQFASNATLAGLVFLGGVLIPTRNHMSCSGKPALKT